MSRDQNGNACTLQEVADVLGVTRERVRQIEAGALRKLAKLPQVKQMREQLHDEQLAFTDTVRISSTKAAWERLFDAMDRTDDIMRRPMPARFKRRAK